MIFCVKNWIYRILPNGFFCWRNFNVSHICLQFRFFLNIMYKKNCNFEPFCFLIKSVLLRRAWKSTYLNKLKLPIFEWFCCQYPLINYLDSRNNFCWSSRQDCQSRLYIKVWRERPISFPLKFNDAWVDIACRVSQKIFSSPVNNILLSVDSVRLLVLNCKPSLGLVPQIDKSDS